jgi:hypothetical protein
MQSRWSTRGTRGWRGASRKSTVPHQPPYEHNPDFFAAITGFVRHRGTFLFADEGGQQIERKAENSGINFIVTELRVSAALLPVRPRVPDEITNLSSIVRRSGSYSAFGGQPP